MDDGRNPDIVCPSAGIHVVLPDYYSPSNMGLLDPATSDGRVIFFLPWQVRWHDTKNVIRLHNVSKAIHTTWGGI